MIVILSWALCYTPFPSVVKELWVTADKSAEEQDYCIQYNLR